MRGLGTAKTKEVVCTHCGGRNEVARRAMSVFCAHCQKRLILEDYNIKSYQAVAGYATCGDVIVHKQGRVAAPIQAANLTVMGVVQGAVRVRGRVEIAPTGTLTGRVSAPSITVSDGARLEAYCEIRPEPPAENVKPAGVIGETTSEQPKAKAAAPVAGKRLAAPAPKKPAPPPAPAETPPPPVRRTRIPSAPAPAAHAPPEPSAPQPDPARSAPKVVKSISTRRKSTAGEKSKK